MLDLLEFYLSASEPNLHFIAFVFAIVVLACLRTIYFVLEQAIGGLDMSKGLIGVLEAVRFEFEPSYETLDSCDYKFAFVHLVF